MAKVTRRCVTCGRSKDSRLQLMQVSYTRVNENIIRKHDHKHMCIVCRAFGKGRELC